MRVFIQRLARLLWPQRNRLAGGVLCGVLYAISNSLLMLVIKLTCDILLPVAGSEPSVEMPGALHRFLPRITETINGWLGLGGTRLEWILIAAIPAVMGLRGLASYGNFYFLARAGNQAMHELRVAIFDHLLRLPVGYFNAARTGDLIARILTDTSSLKAVVETSLATIVKEPLTILFLLTGLLAMQPRLSLVSLLVFPICVLPIVIFGRKVRKAAKAASISFAQLSDTMQEAFSGQRVVKAYNLEPEFSRRFRQFSRNIMGQTMRSVRGHELPSLLIEFSAAIGVALVFYFVMRQRAAGGPVLSAGDLASFLTGIFLLYQPFKNLSRFFSQVQQARAASDRIHEVLQTAPDIKESSTPKPLHAAGADIEFDHVTFRYADKPAVQDFSLKIKAGQMVALVGASGSGKTTLTNLLLRFFDPQEGSVRIGGLDLREVSTRQLREQISVVTQEIILFNDTIRTNIRLGRPAASDAEVEAAARAAHAAEFILAKPGGFEFVIGERGSALSGGQKQRLAIARAILRDAPILILDEATSALDTESERAVQAGLEELMQGRTTFCVAHRLSTVQHADLIVVLDRGRIAEQGAHEELLARGGMYARLHALQFQL